MIRSDSNALAVDHIFLRRSPVGYVCAGLGAPTSLLRLAFEDIDVADSSSFGIACRRLDKAVAGGGISKARRLGLEIPLDDIKDPALRRLAIATALLKAGFNQAEDRDQNGRGRGRPF